MLPMPMIRCTRRLQKAVGIPPVESADPESSASVLGDWFANLIEPGEDQCVIFVNGKTFINFVIDFRSADTASSLISSFSLGLSCILSELGTPKDTKERLLSDYGDISFGNTNDRRIVGTMNQLAFEYTFMITDVGGIHSPEVPAIMLRANRTPVKPLNWQFPVEALQALYQSVK